MPLADYHMHTPLCHHAEGTPLEYLQAAVDQGLAEIGMSDHSPMASHFDDWRMEIEAFPRYLDWVEEARAACDAIPLRLGLEVDFLPGHEAWIEKLTAMAPWDYLIGSVHYITPDWDVDNPRWVGSGRWEAQPVDEVWALYWKAFAKCVRSGLFDFIAHPDLVKKFGHVPSGDLRRFYEPAVQALADAGAVMEINTAGLRNGAGSQYPSRPFLELAFQARVPIMINSDAHKPSDVGRDFETALRLAWDVGYRDTVRWEKRWRKIVPLPHPDEAFPPDLRP